MATDTQEIADDFDFLQSGPASTSGRSDAELLKSALMNEKAAPEILQFETDLIERIESNMDYQVSFARLEEFVLGTAAAADSFDALLFVALQDEQIELLKEREDMKLLVEIFMSELSRVRYLLRVYLRVRLQKVERHVMYILDSADVAARLSEREAQYARDFFVLFGSHMKAAAANHLPGAAGWARPAGAGWAWSPPAAHHTCPALPCPCPQKPSAPLCVKQPRTLPRTWFQPQTWTDTCLRACWKTGAT